MNTHRLTEAFKREFDFLKAEDVILGIHAIEGESEVLRNALREYLGRTPGFTDYAMCWLKYPIKENPNEYELWYDQVNIGTIKRERHLYQLPPDMFNHINYSVNPVVKFYPSSTYNKMSIITLSKEELYSRLVAAEAKADALEQAERRRKQQEENKTEERKATHFSNQELLEIMKLQWASPNLLNLALHELERRLVANT